MTTTPAPNHVLRTWRETHGYTRAQMAAALSQTPAAQHSQLTCTANLITRWENGAIRWPRTACRAALHQLTGHQPADLGFTTPTPRRWHQPPPTQATPTPATGPASTPSHPSTDADLDAIDDLAALASLLHTRGYTTHLAASLPTLTIHHPDANDPLHITATGPAFCWGGTAICQRPPATTLATAAEAIEAIDLAWPPAHQDTSR